MKKLTKITSVITATILAVTATPVIPADFFGTAVYAFQDNGQHYFYEQLENDAQNIYRAMEEMLDKGIFKTGTEDFDLVENKYLTQEEAELYAHGSTQFISAYGAARDAFYMDHADVFYVDFSKLSVICTSDDGGYHIYIGAERADNYYSDGFSNKEQVNAAVKEFDAAVESIADQAKELTAGDGENIKAKQAEFVHDHIINNTSYRLEDACRKENIGFIRTAYGALVKGESVCEGYSRAFKSVMDKLGIPCVLVNGVFRHGENTLELHMWCEVQIDEKWYAVDATMDDPISKNASANGIDGYENKNYLLVGESVMSRQHIPSGILSEVQYEFEYPGISEDSFNVKRLSYGNGLSVTLDPNGEFEGEKAGIFHVSYKGMGVAKAAEQGKYLLCKASIAYENTGEWDIGEWAYVLPELYPAIEDTDTEAILPFSHINYVEFAVTDIAPPTIDKEATSSPDFAFHGDPMFFEAYTESIYNPSGNYVRPPVVCNITPKNSGRIYYGQTYHVVAQYDDKLILENENVQPTLDVSAENVNNNGAGTSAIENSKIEHFKWDGNDTVEFDFTPSEQWLDDSVAYTFMVKGLLGSKSEKAPREFSYYVYGKCAVCAYRSQGIQWNLFGKPSLMENFDIDTTDWKSSTGEAISNKLLSRMALVVTEPSKSQEHEMMELIEEKGDEEILKSKTYNINLTICNLNVISTGDGVRVQLGFPEGYGPEDEGVTFKVYHFIKDSTGNIVDVEELPCVITKYGLVIICKSFSPFAVVAVPKKETEVGGASEKTVLVSASEGGKVSESIFTVKKGESKALTITANNGFEIDSVFAAGKYVELNDKASAKITVNYDDLAENSNIIDVQFISKAALERNKEKNGTKVLPCVQAAEIQLDTNMSVLLGEDLVIAPVITSLQDDAIVTYQWSKDGQPLEDQKSDSLTVENVTEEDAGTYTLTVITASGATTAQAESSVVVTVSLNSSSGNGSSGNVTASPSVTESTESTENEATNSESTENTAPSPDDTGSGENQTGEKPSEGSSENPNTGSSGLLQAAILAVGALSVILISKKFS